MAQTTKDHCFEDIKHRILSTDLAPGSDLDEASLAAHYGMSRTPLREVLQRLAGTGYISTQENRSAKVASMDMTTLRTFFQTAPMIYANVARLAAENRTAAQLDALKGAQQDFRKTTQANAPGDAALANHRFHGIITSMAANIYLDAAMGRLLIDHTRLSQTFYRPASPAESALIQKAADQHDAMIVALEARDCTHAIELTLQHWDLSKDRMERFVRPDPLPVDLLPSKDQKHAV